MEFYVKPKEQAQTEKAQQRQPGSPREPWREKFRFCPNCGHKAEAWASSCPGCGYAFAQSRQSQTYQQFRSPGGRTSLWRSGPLLVILGIIGVIGIVAIGVVAVLSTQHTSTSPQIETPSQDKSSPPSKASGGTPAQPATPPAADSSGSATAQKPATDAKLQELIDKLNKQAGQQVIVVGNQPQPGQVVIQPGIAPADATEMEVWQAAINYYATVQRGNYVSTYSMLTDGDRRRYSQSQWVQANQNLNSAASEYVVRSVERISPNGFNVTLTVFLPDGTSSDRTTRFIGERGQWHHQLTSQEQQLFDDAL